MNRGNIDRWTPWPPTMPRRRAGRPPRRPAAGRRHRAARRAAERRRQRRLGRIVEDAAARDLVQRLTDEVLRIDAPADGRGAGSPRIVADHGVPAALGADRPRCCSPPAPGSPAASPAAGDAARAPADRRRDAWAGHPGRGSGAGAAHRRRARRRRRRSTSTCSARRSSATTRPTSGCGRVLDADRAGPTSTTCR